LRDKVEFEFGKMVFSGEILRKMMKFSLEEIITYVTQVANNVKTLGQPINAVILVGGFASSNFMNDEIKVIIEERLGIMIKRPTHCELAVLRGAVLFGHNEKILTLRVVRMTYSIGVTIPYSSEYPENKKIYLTQEFVRKRSVCPTCVQRTRSKNRRLDICEQILSSRAQPKAD
jgi:hypothetical protein